MTNIQEIWKPIKGHEAYYQISNLGRVKSIKSNWKGRLRDSQKILKQSIHMGYLSLKLSNPNSHKRVHRLIAEAFIPNPDNKPWINHIDGNKLNNSLDNIEWCTPKENTTHAYDTGLINNRGIENKRAKLTESQVIDIYKYQGFSLTLSKKYRVDHKTIRNIRKNISWKHITQKLQY